MDEKFKNRLIEYLDSECSDYDMTYEYTFDEDLNMCEVTISNSYCPNKCAYLNFKYNKKEDDLMIELCEDSFYVTREFDYTVKYFWMLVSSILFSNTN